MDPLGPADEPALAPAPVDTTYEEADAPFDILDYEETAPPRPATQFSPATERDVRPGSAPIMFPPTNEEVPLNIPDTPAAPQAEAPPPTAPARGSGQANVASQIPDATVPSAAACSATSAAVAVVASVVGVLCL